MKRISLIILLIFSCFLSSAQSKGKCSILVDKGSFTLFLLSEKGDSLMRFPVAIGENPGRKTKQGDCKTPEGVFTVTWVQNTKGIRYDYHDGNGKVDAYGPFFIHFNTPVSKTIGIHGTCRERVDRIGTRDSKGCIRLLNEDLLKLLPYVYKGMKIKIIPGPEDILADKGK